MNKEPVIGQLHPLNGCVLVELQQSTKNFNVKESKYQTRTEGIVIDIAPAIGDALVNELIGKRVHFEEFKEGARIKRDGKIYSFIKLEDIRGWEDDEQTNTSN